MTEATLYRSTRTQPTPVVPVIECRNLKKRFGSNVVLDDFNISVDPGENVVVMGRSGIGKTVLIKCIIGLIKPDSGSVKVFGEDVLALPRMALDDLRMRIGYVFQSSALYDSMTVRENLLFPLRRHRKAKITEPEDVLIREALRNVGLEHAIDLMPSELSGGMQKRIGIARALILKPQIVLYDEPTTGLDPITAAEITRLILELQRKYKTASIIITHDMDMARVTANRIVFIIDGKATYNGTFDELKLENDPRINLFFK
jgi:phospholipid/cholesterol/gamma-HCH transport system ATP-binding protein